MKKALFTSLVKGERYEDEFNYLYKEFSKQGIDYRKYTPEVFNFNEKLKAIKPYLTDTLVLLDTDHMLRGKVKLNLLEKLEEGIFVQYFRSYLIKDSLEEDVELNGYFEVLKSKYGHTCINFLDESMIVFNIPDEKKRNLFVETWGNLIEYTKHNSPFRISDQNYGALEGCLIAIAASEAGIPIYEDKLREFFDTFEHYGPVRGHRIKVTATVV